MTGCDLSDSNNNDEISDEMINIAMRDLKLEAAYKVSAKTGENVEDVVSVTVKPRRNTQNSLFRVKCCESGAKSRLLWQAVINAKNLGSFTMKSNEGMPGIWSLLL